MTNMFQTTEQIPDQEIQAFAEKYKNDPAEMAKALAHANKFIDTLKAEKAGAMTIEEAVAQIKAGIQNTPSPTPAPTPAPQSNVLDDNTLNQKVEELLNKRTKAERDSASQELVRTTLLEKFQTPEKASLEMSKKASELGMTAEEFEALAIRSPKAVFQMLGIDGNKQTVNTAPNRSTINTPARQSYNPSQQGDGLSKYTAILREPKGYEKYMSKDTQIKIMAEAMANPAAFGINV